MGFFSKLFDKMEQNAAADLEKQKAKIVQEFEDDNFDRIDDYQQKILDLIDNRIDDRKNEGKKPEDIIAMFDSVIVKYADSKIWPFFDKHCEFDADKSYKRMILDYIENEKQDFIKTRLDYYKEAYEKKQRKSK